MISGKDIEARIVRALAGQAGTTDTRNLAVTFDNEIRTLQVEPDSGDLRVVRLSFEPRSGRFDVSFELPGSAVVRRPLRFTGSLVETFETVVPLRALAQGEIIRASDLTTVRRPKAEYAANVVTTAEQVSGLSTRHALRAGQPIRQNDLIKPELVTRNETVTIVYEVPGIVLTARGKAAEGGALGDVINVINVQSNKTVQATVVGPGRVSVAAATPRVAANAAQPRPSSFNSTRQ